MQLLDKDRELIAYLFAVKSASLEQINRDIYQYEKMNSLYVRVLTLVKAGLLTYFSSPDVPNRKIIHLTNKAFTTFLKTGEELQIELKSDVPAHDLALVDIRNKLLEADTVKGFYTENMLQTWPEYRYADDLSPFADVNADGVIEVTFGEVKSHLAVEYEASRKAVDRCRDTIRRYYLQTEIPGVLFICKDTNVMNAVRNLEIEHCEKYAYDGPFKKFFYKTLSELAEDPLIIFSNADSNRLPLGQANALELSNANQVAIKSHSTT